jgi:hypothetical protein
LVDSRCHICIASSGEGHCHCQSANEATGSLPVRPTRTHTHTRTLCTCSTLAHTRARAVTHTHRPGPTRPRRPAMAGPLAAPCQAAKLPTRKPEAEVSCGAQLRKRRGGPASTGREHRLGSRPRRPGPGAAMIRASTGSVSASHGGAAGGACAVAYTGHLAARALLSGHSHCSKVH